jgi:hypothetical protein
MPMDIRFYIDPETSQPHIYRHGVTEEEATVPKELLPAIRELIAKHKESRKAKKD